MTPTLALEAAAFIVVACGAILTTLFAVERAPSRRVLVVCALVVIVASTATALQWQRSRSRIDARSATALANRPVSKPDDGYATAESCRACHPHQYATWHRSYHRSMTQVATAAAAAVEFDGRELVAGSKIHRLERQGEELWITTREQPPGGTPGETIAERRKVELLTGSHHQQVFWYSTARGRELEMFDLTYHIAEDQWMPVSSIFLLATGSFPASAGRWNQECSRCHTTRPKPRPDDTKTEFDTEVSEFGISCEACHGPAADHVRSNHLPLHRYGLHLGDDHDQTIVEPTRLSGRRGSQVCGLCHSISGFATNAEFQEYLSDGFRYEPGDDLTDTRMLSSCIPGKDELRPGCVNSFWSDGMIRVTGREYHGLVQSPCYADQEFSCMSCHQLHQKASDPRAIGDWADDQLKYPRTTDTACVQCHAQPELTTPAHSHHEPGSSGALCVNCHMPNTTYGVQAATRSHQVSSPSLAANLATGRPNACNLCHLDRTLGWTAGHLEAWYGQPRPQLNGDQETIAASVQWSVSGDAGLRALMAWHYGWEPALKASGSDWMPPYLAQLLTDPYDVVRFIATRSLRKLDRYEDFEFDFMAPLAARLIAQERVLIEWDRGGGARTETLLGDGGRLQQATFDRLLAVRDDTPMFLAE